jgi:hypothetical protein
MNVYNIDPSFRDLGVTGAKLLTPGRPDWSVLPNRPASSDPLERMPPLGTAIVDDAAIAIVDAWIQSPDVCVTESDIDLDSLPDDADNCPGIGNPNQSVEDRDGVGNTCDSKLEDQ